VVILKVLGRTHPLQKYLIIIYQFVFYNIKELFKQILNISLLNKEL